MQRQAEGAAVEVDGRLEIGHVDVDQDAHEVFPQEGIAKHSMARTPRCNRAGGLRGAKEPGGATVK